MLSGRIYVKEWGNGATSVYFEPTDGALPYDCVACLDATGGVCAEHGDPDYREPDADG